MASGVGAPRARQVRHRRRGHSCPLPRAAAGRAGGPGALGGTAAQARRGLAGRTGQRGSGRVRRWLPVLHPAPASSQVWAQLLDELGLHGDERVLDIGCGRGAVLILAARPRARTARAVGSILWRRRDQSGNSRDAAFP